MHAKNLPSKLVSLYRFTNVQTNYSGMNQIYTVFLGANVMPGSQVSVKTTHYSVLRTIEDTFGVGTLGRNDETATPITGIWK